MKARGYSPVTSSSDAWSSSSQCGTIAPVVVSSSTVHDVDASNDALMSHNCGQPVNDAFGKYLDPRSGR